MATLIIQMGLDTWEDEAKDNFIAAKISKLELCGAPDISENKKFILNAFIKNHTLAASLKNESRRLIFNFIRKTEIAFNEYCRARSALIEYLATSDQTVTPYFQSLAHLENCIVHLYQAAMLCNGIVGEKQFTQNDGSILDRLNKFYNQIKYIESYAELSEYKGSSSFEMFVKYQKENASLEREEIGDLSTTPIWITNYDIECKMSAISFAELSKQIMEYYEESEEYATYDVNKHK